MLSGALADLKHKKALLVSLGFNAAMVMAITGIIFRSLSAFSLQARVLTTIPLAAISCYLAIKLLNYGISVRNNHKDLKSMMRTTQKGFKGDLSSQLTLADIFLDPNNPSFNKKIGINWLKMAARNGDLGSQLKLVDLILDTAGSAKTANEKENWGSLKEPFEWILSAAIKGNSLAKRKVGEMYYLGLGCEQNQNEAARWFMGAADDSDAVANLWLAYLYLNGQGVPQDRVMGLTCYLLAERTGKTDATLMEKLVTGMDESQIIKARDFAMEITGGRYVA